MMCVRSFYIFFTYPKYLKKNVYVRNFEWSMPVFPSKENFPDTASCLDAIVFKLLCV